jgi:signal transduction histidine kinase/ActR/RegA family two-component response regulator
MKGLIHNTPIRRKVATVILLTCVAALVVAGVALFGVQVVTFRQNFFVNLQTVAEIIEHNATAALTFRDRSAATEILSSLKASKAVTYASMELPDGSIFATYEVERHHAHDTTKSKEEGFHFQNGELIRTERIVLDGELIGVLHLHADYAGELRKLLQIYGAILIGVLSLAVFLAFVLSGRLRSSIADPILGLAKAARAVVQNNDYAVRAVKIEDDEIGTLTDAFNQMLEHIESQSVALQEARDCLEVRVVDRTAMLKKANSELTIATAEAAAANRAKSEFLSRMSHELRTPMNAILGFGQLLEMEDTLDVSQSENVVQILSAGNHLLDLIDEVLDISRIESGHMSLSLEAVSVRLITQETIDLMRPQAVKSGVELIQTVPKDSVLHVLADRQRLKQTLVNLLSNAIKYNCASGKVTVRCEELPQNSSLDETVTALCSTLRIMVTDTGIGIPAEKLKRLFTPFDRLDAERTQVEGTGLGLALSKKMTELMGGALGVESEIDRGSKFWVDLPAAECPVETLDLSSARVPSDVPDAPARAIVYIEDNLSNLRVIEAIFTWRTGIKLFTAMQGSIGINLVREHSPDLVLLDLNLPDMSGREVLARLRADPKTCEVPVLVLTADATPGQRERLLALGANSYLTKPLNVPAFLKIVDDMLAKNPRDLPHQHNCPSEPLDATRETSGPTHGATTSAVEGPRRTGEAAMFNRSSGES